MADTEPNPPKGWAYSKSNKTLSRGLQDSEAAVEINRVVAEGHFDVVILVKFRSNLVIQRRDAEEAWLTLRRLNPEIAFEVDGEVGSRSFVYPLVDAAAAQAWLKNSFTWVEGADSQALLREQLNRKIPEPGYAQGTFVPAHGDEPNALLINVGHAVNDAHGSLALAHSYLKALTREVQPADVPAWGSETSRFPRSLPAALAEETGEYTPERLEEGKKLHEGQLSLLAKPSISFPLRADFKALSNTTAYHTLSFTEQETATIFRAAKAQGLTVTSVVNAAKLIAQKQLYAPGKEEGAIICYTCNGRRWLKSSTIKDTPSSPSYSSIINFVFVDSAKLDDPNGIVSVGSYIQQVFRDILKTPVSAWGFSAYLSDAYQAMRKAQDWDKPGLAFLSVSSIGVLDDAPLLKDPKALSEIDITDVQIAVRQCDFGPWSQIKTLNGKLILSFQYSNRYFDEQDMSKFLPKTKEVLLQWAGDGASA